MLLSLSLSIYLLVLLAKFMLMKIALNGVMPTTTTTTFAPQNAINCLK